MKTIVQSFTAVLLSILLASCQPIVNSLAFYPDSVNVIPIEELPGGVNEITINTADGVKITSLYLPSPASEKLLIYFHGNAGNIYHRIPSLIQLQNFGINVIGVSYRGYGKSEGRQSEDGIYLDSDAVFRYAVEQLGFTEDNTVLFGRSIGTATAIHAAQDKKLSGVILVTPFTSGKAIAGTNGIGWLSFIAGESFNNIDKVDKITSPLLVIHGTADRIVPYSMGEAIFERAKVNKQFITIEGAGHNNLHDDYAPQYWKPISEFIQRM